MIGSILQNLDPEQARAALSQMDDDAIDNAVQTGVEEYLVPELEDVREAAHEEYPDPQQVREKYESMSEERQNEVFHEAVADLLAVFAELRTDPTSGGEELKKRLRSPYTTEALLLIFDHPDVPDEVVQQQKEFAAVQLQWAGANLIPEVYGENELEEIVETLYPDSTVEEAIEMYDGRNDGE